MLTNEEQIRAFNKRIMEKRIEQDCYNETGLYELAFNTTPQISGKCESRRPYALLKFVDESDVLIYSDGDVRLCWATVSGRQRPTMAERWHNSPEGQKVIDKITRREDEIAHAV